MGLEYPLSEIIDRLSILLLKTQRLAEDDRIRREMRRFRAAAEEFPVARWNLSSWVQAQYEINSQIWDMEAAIRQGKEQELGLEEVGRRAIKLRDLNKERIRRKNEIAAAMGEFEEVKVDHLSA